MTVSYGMIKQALAGQRLPAAFVDLDAFDANAARVRDLLRGRGTPLRIASKSLRVPELLRRLLDRSEGDFVGLMCFCTEEAAFLAGLGFDDGHHRQHAVASLLEADHAIVDHRVAALSNGADDTGRTDDTGVTAAERLSLCSSLSDRPKSHLFSRRAGARILAS